ncbi:hypothetical protein B0T19DRAFT_402776 [Cercophora scortea]|uniref:Uncharacterized protein n=1 Tax=Cercophora scortea TaxID=314031 RepID=A0AAE0IG50_9PEZI|nr:hypothetical protein B0T19DRAFT_402776 [Cercophora scortea]
MAAVDSGAPAGAAPAAPAPLPSAPERAMHRTYHGEHHPQGEPSPDIELEQMPSSKSTTAFAGAGYQPGSSSESGSAAAAAVTPGKNTATVAVTETGIGPDLEGSRPPSSMHTHDGVEVVAMQSMTDPYMNRFRLLATCLVNFGNGMNDSAPGALLPAMMT